MPQQPMGIESYLASGAQEWVVSGAQEWVLRSRSGVGAAQQVAGRWLLGSRRWLWSRRALTVGLGLGLRLGLGFHSRVLLRLGFGLGSGSGSGFGSGLGLGLAGVPQQRGEALELVVDG